MLFSCQQVKSLRVSNETFFSFVFSLSFLSQPNGNSLQAGLELPFGFFAFVRLGYGQGAAQRVQYGQTNFEGEILCVGLK